MKETQNEMITRIQKENPKSDISGLEKRFLELSQGSKPRNEDERILLAEIEAIRKSGGIVDIPFD